MNVSAWSIRNPVPAILLFAMLTFLGILGFRAMGVQSFVDLDFPVVVVTAQLEGAAPTQLETEVARKIEDALAGLTQVEHIRSTLTEGTATISVEFALEKPIQEGIDDVRDALNRVRGELPADLKDPIISKLTVTGQPILTYSVSADHLDEEGVSWFVDDTVARTLSAIPGVGKVQRLGGVTREVRIELDPVRMQALGITAEAVSATLAQVHQETAGGRTDLGGGRQSLRVLAMTDSARELASLEIPGPGGRRLRLDQIATVKDTVAEPTVVTRLDGKTVVGFDITRTRGSSEVTVAAKVRAAVAKLGQNHPQVQIREMFNTVELTEANFHESMELLIEGAVLAVIVVFWFLREWRLTLISAIALPLSVIPTFLAMQMFGFSLNVVTLLAMSLVVGILVDDAIVEVENIVRHLRMGKTPYQAAMEAADEIGLAVIATTFTLVAVFLPTAFMGGIPGKVFREFGWTAAVAVVASLVVARLLTPMMCAYLLKPVTGEAKDGWWMAPYLAIVRWSLAHRFLTMFSVGLFLAGSVALAPFLSTTFIPASDRGQTRITLELPPGATLEDTRRLADQATEIVGRTPEVTTLFTVVGSTAGNGFDSLGSSDVRKATITVILKPHAQRNRSQTAIEKDLRRQLAVIPGARMTLGLGESGEKLDLILAGNDAKALADASQAVIRDLRTLPGLGAITSDASLLRPEIQITPDFARAADLGVTSAALMNTVRVATGGDFAVKLAKLNLPQRQLAIRVRLADAARADLDALSRLRIPGSQGPVLLGSVAAVELASGPAQIDRLDRQRKVGIAVELNGRLLGDITPLVDRLPSLQHLPAGVTRSVSGDAERMAELFGGFAKAMLIGLLCIYMVLVLLFHDFLQPATILAALPLAIGGALGALLLTGNSFSMPSVIGLLMLMGITTKNSILLVDYAVIALREKGLPRREAILDACHKRARPILMTTIAMGAGMLPIALGWSVDPSFRSPMAVAVIGGLITSTFLSLIVIPVVFTLMDDVAGLFRWRPAASPSEHPEAIP